MKASVIVCVYNRPRQVVACLESLVRLEDTDFEIVLVNDGSTDETGAVLEAFAKAHGSVPMTILHNARNLGVSGARNAGIAVARGELVFFTDSDCQVEPPWLGALVGAFADPEVAAAYGSVVDATPTNWAEQAYRVSPSVTEAGWRKRPLIGNNMGFRRAVLADYPFDPAFSYYCDEVDLAQRLLSTGRRIAFVKAAVVRHDHAMTVARFAVLGYRQAQGSARFWYKHGILGKDLLPAAAALATTPLLALGFPWAALPLFLILVQFAAIGYGEMHYKGRSFAGLCRTFPLVCLHHACRAWGVAVTLTRIASGDERAIRASKQTWTEFLRRGSPEAPGARHAPG